MKRHQPRIRRIGSCDEERCVTCGAARDMWGGRPLTSWLLHNTKTPWCPGPPKKESPNG